MNPTVDSIPGTWTRSRHWYIQRAGENDYSVIDGQLTSSLSYVLSTEDDGAQVIARLFGHEHEMLGESEPVTVVIDDHGHEPEPVETTITVTGLAHHYHSGDTLALEASQDPETGEDHWHWYIQRDGEDDYTVIPEQATSSLSYVLSAEDDGAQVIARLFNHDHEQMGESEPVTISIDDHGHEPGPDPDPEPSPDPDPDDDRLVLDHGHVDAFHVSPEGDSLKLQLKEDVTGQGVLHTPENFLLVVKEEAFVSDLPGFFPGAPEAYALPITQNPNLLWPGWETTPVGADGFGQVDIQVVEIDGPGEVHVFGAANYDETVDSVLADGGTELPGTIVAPFPAHTHANWVFTEAGEYTFTVQAAADKDGQSYTSEEHTYTWRVGDYEGDPDDNTPPPGGGDNTPPPRWR